MLILALLACVTEDNYLDRSVAVSCDRAEECDKGSFESAYDDQADCRDQYAEASAGLSDCYAENCTFDAKQAAACLQAARTATCDAWTNGDYTSECDTVYTDCDDVDLAICVAGVVF